MRVGRFSFDEPLSNPDTKLRVAMYAEIKALQQAGGAPRTLRPTREYPAAGPAPAARDVVFGIRPDHIVTDQETVFRAKMTVVEPTSSETHVLLKAGRHKLTCVLRQRVLLPAGQTVPIAFAVGPNHFFDRRTRQRID